jgi:probable O-glycosylation ligase (exosortase A-associated)
MRDVIFTLLICGLLPVCFRRPLIGLLVFSWLAYMRTQDLCWGFARKQRWSFLVAAVTLAGYFSRPREKLFVSDPRCWAMLLLVVQVGLSTGIGAIEAAGRTDSEYQINRYIEFVKVIGVALFTTAVVVRREHLRVLVWVIALSFGFYGIKVGLAGVLSLGRIKVLQGPGGMLEDNNNFALALTMSLPMLLLIAGAERKAVLRRGVLAMVPLTMVAIVLTHSRGGFLALTCTIAALVWRSRHRMAAAVAAFLLFLVGSAVAPDSLVERITSIRNYEQDGSAMGRIAAWKTGVNMAKSNPVFGVGLNMFTRNYQKYRSGDQHEGRRVAHSAYVQIWAECGTPALILYLFLIGWTFRGVWRIRRRARQLYYSSWIISYATMFEASLVAFVVGSAFLNRAGFDYFYHLVAIVIAFERIAAAEMEALPRRESGRGAVRVVRENGFRRSPLGAGALGGA